VCVSKNQCVLLGSPLFLWGAPFFPLGLAPCVLGLGLGSRVGACPSLPGPLACAACGVASPSSVPWSLLCPLLLSLRSCPRCLLLARLRLGSLPRCCPSLLLLRSLCPSSRVVCRLGRGWCRRAPSSRLLGVWCRPALPLTLVGWWWWLVVGPSAACGRRWVVLVRRTLWPWWLLAVLPVPRVLPWSCGLLPVSRASVAPATSAVSRRNCLPSSFGRALRCATCWWHTRGCLNRRSSVHVLGG
jgi:hypothetical protein